jgi:hypothetical protein
VDRGSAAYEAHVVQQIEMQRMFVWIPSTTISDKAIRIRWIACSRVAPYAITFPIMES